MKILSQRDTKWKDQKLGFGSTTIEFYGCTITSLAMLADLTPEEVNNRLKSVGGYAGSNKNLVVWSKIKEAIPWLEFQWRGYEYNNDKVKEAINQSGGCLVEVDGSRIGASRHWVLYVGDQQMHDPWFGTKKATSYYKPVGYATIKRIGNKPQEPVEMLNELQEVLDHYSVKTKDELISMIDEQLKFLKDERDKTNRLQEQIDSLKADNANYKSEASSRKQELDKFIEELAKRMFLPATSDKSDVIGGVDRLLTVEDQLTTAKKQLIQEEKKHDLEKSDMQKEINELRASLEKQAAENKTLLGRIENLEKRLNDNEEASSTTDKWKDFIDALLKIFKKG